MCAHGLWDFVTALLLVIDQLYITNTRTHSITCLKPRELSAGSEAR